MQTPNDFLFAKHKQQPITMVTCYDYTSALMIQESAIDAVLVGDSGGLLQLGKKNTPQVTMQDMIWMTRSVSKGLSDKLIVADMPFLSYRQSLASTMSNVEALIQAGGQAIKLEGAGDNLATIEYITRSDIPVMGHLGLSPQAVCHSKHQSGYHIDALPQTVVDNLLDQAKALEQAGCFAIILVYVPAALAQSIAQALTIPVIGIASGELCDGQIHVWHDLLGLAQLFNPRFVKSYADGYQYCLDALNAYVADVQGTLKK